MRHSDEPVLEDFLEHAQDVEAVARDILSGPTPFVMGVHGDWGAGKSSFLMKLRWFLAGSKVGPQTPKELNELGKTLWRESYKGGGQGVETIWFEAWRYQFETTPIVALLNEIRAHFAEQKGFVARSRRALDQAGKLTYAALMSIEEVTKQIGIQPSKIVKGGEKWERDRLQEPLPSKLCRDLLDDAIRTLLGRNKERRLIVMIDDLDRCEGHVAFRLLEALKIYLSIPSCVFVLGLDWRTIRQAVAGQMIESGMIDSEQSRAATLLRADDYLDKLCQGLHRLPLIADARPYLTELITVPPFADPEDWIGTIIEHRLLPANPRKIKSFIGGLIRYVNQMATILVGVELDRDLALVVSYLKQYENDVFRILENDERFWNEIVRFCRIGGRDPQADTAWPDMHPVFAERKLRDAPEYSGTAAVDQDHVPAGYSPLFPDPADERVLRVAELVRAWDNTNKLTPDLFRQYVQLRSL